MLLGGVFKATGNQSPVTIPAKGAWMMTDLPRFAKRYGVPYVRNPHFPINTLNLMRGAIAAEMEGRLIPYSDAIFRAMLGRQKRMEDPIVIGAVLREAGFDPAAMMAAIGTAGGEGQAQDQHRRSGRARRIRRADLFRRRCDVLRAGPTGFRRGGSARQPQNGLIGK